MRDKFNYGGGTHVALRYARMNRTRPISVEQTLALFPHKFSKPSRVVESFSLLTRQGLLTETKKGWVITILRVLLKSTWGSLNEPHARFASWRPITRAT